MGTGQQKNEQIVSAQADSGSMQSSQDIKLSWREKICYGFGDLGNGFMWLFGGFCGRDSGIGPAQRAKTTIWN